MKSYFKTNFTSCYILLKCKKQLRKVTENRLYKRLVAKDILNSEIVQKNSWDVLNSKRIVRSFQIDLLFPFIFSS